MGCGCGNKNRNFKTVVKNEKTTDERKLVLEQIRKRIQKSMQDGKGGN